MARGDIRGGPARRLRALGWRVARGGAGRRLAEDGRHHERRATVRSGLRWRSVRGGLTGLACLAGIRRETVVAERLSWAARRGVGRRLTGVLPLGRHTRLLHQARPGPLSTRPWPPHSGAHRVATAVTAQRAGPGGNRLGPGGNRAQPYRSRPLLGIPVSTRRRRTPSVDLGVVVGANRATSRERATTTPRSRGSSGPGEGVFRSRRGVLPPGRRGRRPRRAGTSSPARRR
jgi:hypothetical protein